MTSPRSVRVAAVALAASAAPLFAQANEVTRAVAGGGISVAGWAGAVDAQEAKAGMTLANQKLAPEGAGLRVTTGPATTYWNTKAPVAGDYTVKATFTEPKYQNLNDHPHPYGIVVAAAGMDGAEGQALYCAAYGTGTFIMRGFAPAPFRVGAPRPTAHPAIGKAAGPGQPVKQEIAVSVKGDKVSCSINGAEVGSWPKSEVVGAGKLKTTDGFAGIRVGHNAEVVVTGFGASK
jgi:hypothetical protein